MREIVTRLMRYNLLASLRRVWRYLGLRKSNLIGSLESSGKEKIRSCGNDYEIMDGIVYSKLSIRYSVMLVMF